MASGTHRCPTLTARPCLPAPTGGQWRHSLGQSVVCVPKGMGRSGGGAAGPAVEAGRLVEVAQVWRMSGVCGHLGSAFPAGLGGGVEGLLREDSDAEPSGPCSHSEDLGSQREPRWLWQRPGGDVRHWRRPLTRESAAGAELMRAVGAQTGWWGAVGTRGLVLGLS